MTLTRMMRAARLHEAGKPFQVDEMPIPTPTGSDVLVRVHACGIAPNLRNVVTHYPQWYPHLAMPRLPAIYGLDPAGEVVGLGPDALGIAPGQRVYVNPVRNCGTCASCRNDGWHGCASLAMAGYFGAAPGAQSMFDRYPWGGLAEYMIAPAAKLVALPDDVSFQEAARFGYLGTAFSALRLAGAGPDTTVLINGATGTVGVGAVMISLALGVPKILAVARNQGGLAKLRDLAPRRVFTHSTLEGPCTDWALAMTDDGGADIILEALSPGAPAQASLDAFMAAAMHGTIVTVGGADEKLPLDPHWMMVRGISYRGSAWFNTGEGHSMANLAGSGALDLSALEHLCFPLEQVNEALDAACGRSGGGMQNVVVTS